MYGTLNASPTTSRLRFIPNFQAAKHSAAGQGVRMRAIVRGCREKRSLFGGMQKRNRQPHRSLTSFADATAKSDRRTPSTFEELDGYLATIGIENRNERARLIDLNTNPNSLFASVSNKKGSKVYIKARPLNLDHDVKPVIRYLSALGVKKDEIPSMIIAQPAMIGYDVETHIKPLVDCLEDIGVENISRLLVRRPTILGLSNTQSLNKIVDYLKSVDTPLDKIIEYLSTSL
uniref:Uncharacterized protein n=1 Tax=Amorphochlora amoebiformis TaxID=1561963 RepID=A0A7S0D8K6_9EUKA